MLEGIFTAIITPFRHGQVDFDLLERLVERQAEGGVTGVVPCGTTGEGATLTREEHLEVIRRTLGAAKRSRSDCKVIAGIGSNSTADAVALAKHARDMGADAGLTITPYYNKPTQHGMIAHFEAVAEGAPELPLVLYNVPSRTSVCMTVDTLDHLANVPNIVAVKEATADLKFDAEIIHRCGDRMTVLSGDDFTALPLWAIGGRGSISVASNLLPQEVSALWRAFDEGHGHEAQKLFMALLPICNALFWETNPVPVKTLMSWCIDELSADCRLPMVPLLPETDARLRALWDGWLTDRAN